MPPAPRPAWTSHAAAEASSAEAGASASQPSPPSATTVAAVAAASGRPSAGDAAAAAIAIDSAELLSIDRALVTLPELRQTCNAIELLRSAAREGPPIHEWKLSGFASQGPAKVASPPFELYGRRWSLLLHPRGCGANAQGTHISAYLRLEHGPACDARVRLAVRNQHSPTLSTFNKPWQWRFDSNGKNRGVSSLLPLSSANVDAGFVVDDTLVLQLWLRPLGVAESRCLPPGAEDGLPAGDTLQPAARRHFHAKLLHHVWLSNSQALAPAGSPAPAASGCAKLSSGAAGGSAVSASAASGSAAAAHSGAEEVIRVLEQLAPSWCSEDPSWATERHRLQLLALNAAAADGHKETLVALLDSGWMHPVQLYLTNLPAAYARYAGPYEQVASPRRFSYGRPVYRSGHCYLFYAEERVGERDGGVAQWVVGREEDLGCTNGWMFVDDDAVSPELIIGEWQIWEGDDQQQHKASSSASSGVNGADGHESAWRACPAVRVVPAAPFLVVGHSLTPLHYAAWGGQLECTSIALKPCKPFAPNPVPPKLDRRGAAARSSVLPPPALPSLPSPCSAEGGAEADSPLLLAARGTAGAAPVVQLLAAEGFCDYRALGAAATHTVRIGLLEAALLRHPSFMSLVQDPFAQLARAVERFPKPLGAALSNLLGWFSCSLYRDGSTVGPFGSLSAPCQEAVLWRVAEAVLIPPGSTGSTAPLHLCALNESCLWEWLAQWDLMMRMSDKLESLLCEGMDDADGEAAEGVYRNLALRYAAQLEECCQLLYGDEVAAELGIQSDGVSVERWSCGGQFLVDVIGRWVFGPSFWIKEHLWRLPDGPSRWEAYRGYHNQLRGTELLLPASYMSVDPWLLSLGCFRGSSAASGRESTMIRYCLELMQSHARHLEGAEPDESSKSGKSRAEMSLLEAWKAKCPYINALDLKRGKNRPLYSYMSSVITEGIHAEPSTSTASLPTAHEREAVASADTAEMVKWWRTLSVPQRQRLLGFPVIDLERLVWLTPIWEVLLHKLPELIAGEASASQRVACVNGQVQLGPALVSAPEAAIQAMQQARSRELEWTTEAGEGIEAAKQRMLEQLALSMLQQRMLDCHKRDSQEEDAERMAQLLIAEEEESKARLATKAKRNAKKKKKKKGKKGDDDEDDDDAEGEGDDGAEEPAAVTASGGAATMAVSAAAESAAAEKAKAAAAEKKKAEAEAEAEAKMKAEAAARAAEQAAERAKLAAQEAAAEQKAAAERLAAAKAEKAAKQAAQAAAKSAAASTGGAKAGTAASTLTASTSPPPAAAKKGSADVSNEPWQAVGKAAKGSSKSGKASSLTASVTASGTAAVGAGARAGGNGTGSSSPAATAPVHIDPAMVSLLKEMTGAAPKKCEDALRLHNGNADSAALWLLSEAPPPPGGVPPTPESTPARAEAVSPAAPILPVAEARAASGAGAARRDGGRGGSPDLRIDGISVTASSFGSATFGGAVRPTDGLVLDLRAVDGATGGAKPTGSIPQSSSGTLPSVAVNVHTLPSVTSSGGLSPSAAPPTSAFPAGAPSALAAWPPTRVANLALVAESGGFDGAELMGVVRDTPPGKPYGFISVWHHNVTVFYHYNDVVPSAKELVKRHTAVAFSVASWSQGFKAEKVRPLTPLEQRVGAKDGRLGMLRANVKKWSASTGEGLLQLCAQPCSLPFTATGALAARLAVGSALVCKIDGKGKDLVACMLQLAGPVGADPGSPSKAETAQAAQGLPQGLPSPSSVPSPKQASLPPSPTRGAPAPASPANLSAAGGRTLSTELSSSDDAGAPMPQPALSPSIGTLPASVMGHEAVGAAFEKLEELSRATAELSAREMASTFGRAQAVQAAQAAASASAADDEDDAAAGAVPSLAWPILPPALQDALPASPALPPGMLQPVGGPAPLLGGSSGALGAGGGAGDALSQPLFPSIGSLGGSGLCGGGLGKGALGSGALGAGGRMGVAGDCGGWGTSSSFGAGPFGAGAPPNVPLNATQLPAVSARSLSSPVPMVPSFFPQAPSWGAGGGGGGNGWGGSGADGWGMPPRGAHPSNGVPFVQQAAMLAQQAALTQRAAAHAAAGAGGMASQLGQHPTLPPPPQLPHPSGTDASWAASRGPPLVAEANRGKSLGNGGYSLF